MDFSGSGVSVPAGSLARRFDGIPAAPAGGDRRV